MIASGTFLLSIVLIILSMHVMIIACIWLITILDRQREVLDLRPGEFVELLMAKQNDTLPSESNSRIDLRGTEDDGDDFLAADLLAEDLANRPTTEQEVTAEPFSEVADAEVKSRLKKMEISVPMDMKAARWMLHRYTQEIEIPNLRVLYSEGKYEHLITYARIRLKLHPRDMVTRIILIRALFRHGDYHGCKEECERVLVNQSKHMDAHRFAARSMKMLGDEEGALERYRLISEFSWDDIDSRFSLMKHHWNQKEYAEARKYIDEVLKLDPDRIRYHVYSGRILDRLHEHEEAIRRWRALLALDSDNIDALIGIGESLFKSGDHDAAIEYLLLANTNEPDNLKARNSLIQTYTRVGRLNEAMDLLEKGCIENPSEMSVWMRRFPLTLRAKGDLAGNTLIDEMIELNKGSFESYIMALYVCEEFDLSEKKDEILEKAVSTHEDEISIHLALSERLLESDSIGACLHHLRLAHPSLPFEELDHPVLDGIKEFLQNMGTGLESILDENNEVLDCGKAELLIQEILRLTRDREKTEWLWNRNIAMMSSSLGRGGAERQVVACLRALKRSMDWVDVSLICNKVDNTFGRFETYHDEVSALDVRIIEYGIPQFNLAQDILDAEEPDVRNLVLMLPRNIRTSVLSMIQIFNEIKPSIVHSWQDGMNITTHIAASIVGVPRTIMFARSLRPDKKTKMHIYRKRYLNPAYVESLDSKRVSLIHNSRVGLESYSQWLGIKSERFGVIHNGVDFDEVLVPDERKIADEIEAFGLDKAQAIIGGVFRLVDEKQPLLWIDIAERTVNTREGIHFLIVGGGQLLEVMREEVVERGIADRVHLIGQSGEVASWLEKMDLFLLTSRVEGLPNVLIEAQAMGVPVISTNAGGAHETFIDGRTGHLIDADDVDGVSKLILECLDDELWMYTAREEARRYCREKFSQERMKETLLEIYSSAI